MTTSVVFYPHGLYASGILTLTQLSGVAPVHDFEDLIEMAAGQPGPQFSGTHQAKPGIPFNSTQLKDLLDAIVAGKHNIIRDLSAGNVDLELKAGDNLNVREADAAVLHIRARAASNSMLAVETITARQGGLAEAQCRLNTIFKTSTGADPLVFTNDVALSIASDVEHLFTVGPVKLNGTFIEAVEEATLENNIEYEVVWDSGFGFPTYFGVRSYKPRLRFRTRDTRVMNTYGTRGTALSALSYWWRKKLLSGLEVADNVAEHILLTATTGTIKARGLGENMAAEVTVDMTMPAQSTACYEIDTTAAIA